MNEIRLTQFSHGAGCGCKLAPDVLEGILGQSRSSLMFPDLLVGNHSKDDAAVFDLGDGTAMVSTTDFFTPIVDDPFDFGYIAAVNAISDIYAMGGTPSMAIAILGWPIDKLSPNIAAKVVNGGRSACEKAGIPLAGGHSIDIPEPVFGLAVSGRVSISHLKTNDKAQAGDLLFLTKPLGIGLITTAEKRGIALPEDREQARASMMRLNDAGPKIAAYSGVHAMTDITGFGLAGHLLEVCESSGVQASIALHKIPQFSFTQRYISQKCMPGGTQRNWRSYGQWVSTANDAEKALLADPQTSGGLLLCVHPEVAPSIQQLLIEEGLEHQIIGQLSPYKGSGHRLHIQP